MQQALHYFRVTIPKKLLYILAQMDREDAETFTTLCSLAVKVDDEYEPIIWCHRSFYF